MGHPKNILKAGAEDFLVLSIILLLPPSSSKRGLGNLDTLFLFHHDSRDGCAYRLGNWLLLGHEKSRLSCIERATHYLLMLGPGMQVWHRAGLLGKRLSLFYISGRVCKNIWWLERSRKGLLTSTEICSSLFWAQRWAFSKPPLD